MAEDSTLKIWQLGNLWKDNHISHCTSMKQWMHRLKSRWMFLFNYGQRPTLKSEWSAWHPLCFGMQEQRILWKKCLVSWKVSYSSDTDAFSWNGWAQCIQIYNVQDKPGQKKRKVINHWSSAHPGAQFTYVTTVFRKVWLSMDTMMRNYALTSTTSLGGHADEKTPDIEGSLGLEELIVLCHVQSQWLSLVRALKCLVTIKDAVMELLLEDMPKNDKNVSKNDKYLSIKRALRV